MQGEASSAWKNLSSKIYGSGIDFYLQWKPGAITLINAK